MNPLDFVEGDAFGFQPYQQFERLEYEALAEKKHKALTDGNRRVGYASESLVDLQPYLTLAQSGAPGSTQPQVIHSSPQVAERPTSVPGPSTATDTTPLQMVHQPSALFSSNPVRSQVSQAHMPSKNHQIGTELRAPAPHLQPFRPVTSMSAPCFSTPVQPGQQSLNPIRTQFAPSQPTQMPGSFSRVHQSDNTAWVRNTHTHSLSALQLLIDMDRRPSARPQTLFPPVQAVGQFSDTWSIPEQRMTANLRGTGIRSATGIGTLGDVVCLSDDD